MLSSKSENYIVTQMGYTTKNNTNWYPFKIFNHVFRELGFETQWTELEKLDTRERKRRIFICWNEPTTRELVEREVIKEGDVMLQKVTSLGKGNDEVTWGDDPLTFFKEWHWPMYQMVEELYDAGLSIYAFGARTNTDLFPEKHRICEKLGDRLFWIPWGSSLYTHKEIQKARPIMSGFKYDISYVGSKWGRPGRGNLEPIASYLDPLLEGRKHAVAGPGNPLGRASNRVHKKLLRKGRLCPIVNAASWRIEQGVQDRFWTVFTTGRFGVADTEGLYAFFDRDEVECETDPGEYVEKSLFYLQNVEAQLPFIERVQARIKQEYNYYHTWSRILNEIIARE